MAARRAIPKSTAAPNMRCTSFPSSRSSSPSMTLSPTAASRPSARAPRRAASATARSSCSTFSRSPASAPARPARRPSSAALFQENPMNLNKTMTLLGSALGALALLAGPALAQDAAAAKLDTGDTAWMLTSTAQVLMMTIPGLALFYGGMDRRKHELATLTQSFAITCLVSVLWMIFGYSLAFTEGSLNAYIGSLSMAMLSGGTNTTVISLAATIPEWVFIMFQMTFAIITPALITGAFAERMKFSAMMWFMGLWFVLVYLPIAHWVWG